MFTDFVYDHQGQQLLERPKWINARYYLAFVVPPQCPNPQRNPIMDPAPPAQIQPHPGHVQNVHPLVNFTGPTGFGSGQAAQAQHLQDGQTYPQLPSNWMAEDPLFGATIPDYVRQFM